MKHVMTALVGALITVGTVAILNRTEVGKKILGTV